MTADRVVLVLNYPADRQESMLRFGNSLAVSLRSEEIAVSTWTSPQMFAGSVRDGRFGSLTKWLGYIDKFVLGFASLAWHRIRNPGVVWHIVDHGNAMYAFALPWRKVIVTCHDCIAIEEAFAGRTGERVGRFGKLLQRWIVKGMERSGLVAAVSQATLSDLKRLTAVKAEQSTVIHNGLLSSFRRVTEEVSCSRLADTPIPVDNPFVFMIGSNLKRKNRLGAIHSFDCLKRLMPERPLRLIMAGQPWSDDIRESVQRAEFGSDIVEAGTLSNAALEAAYSAAALVTFPSLAEGFGLPIIEAQACGALVVASNIEPLPEVGGDGALYADPNSPAEYAATMARALRMDGDLRTKALENVKRFSTQGWAQAYAAAYAGLSSRPSGK